ncbi:BspA family leucine-rich repeat surface protein [uncultured Lactobacillus sp.]|uniref:BspA family leucine-rich repeat surface protein n=1 Tax=uncultured Lactobacillus sp. TaxID=153152 RepID=UPI0025E0B499|nr:BspA family leucine-rich repeat surface protein [uncultured Lactobacillus sp.]
MNTHKNANKQGEKILLGGVAAVALGLINAKPQTVKAANQNGTRATKKTASRAVKTKLTYQNETDSETEGETATNDDSTGQTSSSQTAGSEANVGTASSKPESGQGQAGANSNPASGSNQDAAAGNTSDPSTTDNAKTDKQEADSAQFDHANEIRDSNTTISSTWENIPVTFNNGVLSIGEKGKTYTINNSDNKDISIGSNIDNVSGDDITEIDINAHIAIIGSAETLFYHLLNLTSINGLDKLDTSKVTSMLQMFMDCTKMTSLDLSSFDTTNVTNFSTMFAFDPSLTSVDLSSFTVRDGATTMGMFVISDDDTPSLSKLILGKGFKFTTRNGRPNNSLQQPGTWVNMGEGDGSLAKGTNQWSSADFMTKYQGDRDHDTYVRYTGGIVTVHRQDEEGKQLVDQDGKEIPDEKLFGNISDSVTVDTSKEFAGYTFKENQNPTITAFISDPQTITLVYSKSKTDNTWEGVPYTFNNGVLSLGEKGKNYPIDNLTNKNISISQNISGVNVDEIKEIDLNAPIAISGSAQRLFSKLSNLVSIKGLNNLQTSQITNFSYMFADCPKLTTLDLSTFETAKATSYSSMFSGDSALTSVDLSSFTVTDDALTFSMFDSCSNLTKLNLGKDFKFTNYKDTKNNSLQQPGTWVNMGEGDGSLAKGTNQWSSADFMTKYQGDRDHDTYVRYTGGIVTVHRQDEEGKQLVDQDGKEIPDEKLFGNISDPVTVDTSKEFAGYKFKENKNSNVKAFISDPQNITLVYSKSKTDNTSDNTWEGVPYTFNNGVLSLGVKGINYTIDNSGNKEKSYALDTRDISISQNIKGVNVNEIKEIDLNAPIAIIGSANGVFKNLKNLATIKGLSNLDTSQVTDFSQMFSGDTALISVDLSSFKVTDNALTFSMFDSCSNLTKLNLGTGFKFTTPDNQPNNSLKQPGTWVNMGEGNGSLTKGTNQWSSADLMTKYQGSTDHDTYKLFTNLGGIVTVHRQDQDGKQLVDQDGKEIPDEKLFGNISDPVTVDTSKEFAGYTFKENKNSNVKAFTSDPQDITLVYTKKTDTGSQGSQGSQGSGSNGSGSNGSSSNGSGNSTPNTSVPNNNPSGNNGSVNNPSSSNSQGSNSQGSNTGNSNNNSSSASNGQNNGSNLPNNEPNNIPSPVNRKPKTVRPHKTINKGFNIKDQNAIHNQQLANSLKNNGSSSNAQNNASNTLPQTGNDKHNSLAMLALGGLALATALGAAWFGRKKD